MTMATVIALIKALGGGGGARPAAVGYLSIFHKALSIKPLGKSLLSLGRVEM